MNAAFHLEEPPVPVRHTERDLLDALHARYSYVRPYTDARRYAVAEHVPVAGPGMDGGWSLAVRVADFLAQDTYSEDVLPDGRRGGGYDTRGGRRPTGERRQILHGFEIKVSRSDWLTELRDPTKADAWRRYCDQWWLVAPRDVVRGDLPEGWGHLAPAGASLRIVTHAPLLTPEPMPVHTRAQFLRAVQKTAARLQITREDKPDD